MQFNGEGTVYFGNLDENLQATGGFYDVGSAYPFSLQTSTQVAKHISRRADGSAGQVLATLVAAGDDGVTGSMTLYDFKANNLALALSGSTEAMTQAAGNLSDQPITMPTVVGEYVDIGKTRLSEVVIKLDSTALVEGTDYLLDAALGMIAAVPGGALAQGGALVTISAAYAALTGLQIINIAAQLQKRVAIKVALRNSNTGERHNILLHQVVLSSSEAVPFISADGQTFESIGLSLSVETPKGKTSPGMIDGVAL